MVTHLDVPVHKVAMNGDGNGSCYTFKSLLLIIQLFNKKASFLVEMFINNIEMFLNNFLIMSGKISSGKCLELHKKMWKNLDLGVEAVHF